MAPSYLGKKEKKKERKVSVEILHNCSLLLRLLLMVTFTPRVPLAVVQEGCLRYLYSRVLTRPAIQWLSSVHIRRLLEEGATDKKMLLLSTLD